MNSIKKYLGSAVVAAFGVNLICFSTGSAFTWTSPVSPKLNSNDSAVNPLSKPISTFEDSLLVSMLLMGALAGTLAGGTFAGKIGKKNALLIFGSPMIAAHILCAFATNIHMFISARFLMGLTVGAIFSVVPIYISEIAKIENRGSLGCIINIVGCLGQTMVYSIGPYISIKIFSFINLISVVLFYFYALMFLPDSPVDLIKSGKDQQAKTVLLNLRGSNRASDVEKELLLLAEGLRAFQNENKSLADLLRDSTLRKSLMITCSIMFFQQFSGIGAITSFLQTICESSGIPISSTYVTVAVAIAALICNVVCSQTFDRMGRKISLVSSTAVCCISLSVLTVYFFLKSANVSFLSKITWLPIFTLILFIIFFNLGLSGVPWILIGELFPASFKSVASTVTAFSCFFFGAVVTFCFPLFSKYLGDAGTFLTFSLLSALGTTFIAIMLPETRNKTFAEIQAVLMSSQKVGNIVPTVQDSEIGIYEK